MRNRLPVATAAALVLALAAPIGGIGPASALSEIQSDESGPPENSAEDVAPEGQDNPAQPDPAEPASDGGQAPAETPAGSDELIFDEGPDLSVPIPGPIRQPSERAAPAPTVPDESTETDRSASEAEQPVPEVVYDLGRLPEPVRRMHALLIEACRSGDIERLRPLVGTGDSTTQLSLGKLDGDAITFLKEVSGDGEGAEMLAILEEVLSAGFVHMDAGTPEELYVWPYFFAVPLDRLDAKQKVELFKIVTAGDYEEMKAYGAYIFYRVGITPEGRWAFFVAGD